MAERDISSLTAPCGETPSWMTRTTVSAIGISTPWRSARSRTERQDVTPSAVCFIAAAASATVSPFPRLAPNV
ncbi:hypothetical protein B7R87_19600 [Streptomyces tsukubensis]|nr:hypothetical protein B7R87_19600 [Streptomyces tsukubensis]